MFCQYCGTSAPDDARFCSSCGKQVAPPAASSTGTPTRSVATGGVSTPVPAPSQFQTVGGNATAAGTAPAESGDLFRTGELFAERYQIARLIGRGGMGAVYEAQDNVLQEAIALKVLLKELSTRTDAVSRFTREAKISRQLSHKNIVRIHDMGSHQGMLFISMELVNGMSLRRFLDGRRKQNKPLSVKELLALARPICDAMEYAHEITVHRDLKPENILVSRDSKVKVSDFGIATLLTLSDSRLTTGAIGTAYYMAPEQMDLAATVDRRADIYALGVILYETLIGKVPVGRFKTPREIRDDIPESIDSAVMRALDPDPELRPETMRDLLAELTAAASFEKSDRAEPAATRVATVTPKAMTAKPKTDAAAAREDLEKGKQLFQANDFDRALEALDRTVQQDASIAEAWYFRAQALNLSKLGVGEGEANRRIAAGKITVEQATEVQKEVLANFKKATELEPTNAVYMVSAMAVEQQLQKNAKFIAGTEPKATNPKSGGGIFGRLLGGGGGPEVFVDEGNTLLNSGQFDAAIKKFDQAIKRDKSNAAAYYGKGMALSKLLGNDTADIMARIARGELSIEQGQRIQTERNECLRRAVQLEPSNALYQMLASQIRD